MNTAQRLTLPLLILFSAALFTPSALAQSALGLSAIPPRLEIEANPGQVVSKQIKVRNESKVEKIISTFARDFIVVDDKGTPVQLETTDSSVNRWAASSWIQISPSQLKLKPGETKSLTLTIITPDNALPGGHYAVILHSPDNDVVIDKTGAAIQTNVGTLVYVTVSGNIKQNAKIKDFTAPVFSEYGPIDFKSAITNLSDIHITPAGSIIIKNMLGGKTAQLALDQTNIFPYTSHDFTNTLNKKWLFGRYSAQINAAYGTTGQVVTASLVFWVIPWTLLILVTIALILVTIIITLLRQKSKNQPDFSTTKVEEFEQELNDLKKKYKDR